jgi:hypothetical protein
MMSEMQKPTLEQMITDAAKLPLARTPGHRSSRLAVGHDNVLSNDLFQGHSKSASVPIKEG